MVSKKSKRPTIKSRFTMQPGDVILVSVPLIADTIGEHPWTVEYYDMVEYFYWEPQRIGRIKDPKSPINNAKKLREKLQNYEVSLNHILNLFFRILPVPVLNDLFGKIFNQRVEDQFRYVGRDLEDVFIFTQPDLYFRGEKSSVFFELKLDSKCTLEQFAKYLLLISNEEKLLGGKRKAYLVFVGKGPFKMFWKEGFNNLQEVQTALQSYSFEHLADKFNLDAKKIKTDTVSVLNNLELKYLNYEEFAQTLNAQRTEFLNKEGIGEQTLVRLYDGILSDLNLRGLVKFI